MPDWLSDLVPDYLSAEMLIWPEDGPKSSPLAAEPHLPCSFGYQYSSLGQIPGGGPSYRQFKDQERLIWGDIVPLVRYYKDQKCLNLSFDGRVYFSGSAWEKEIPTLSGQVLTNLQTTSIPVLPARVLSPKEPRPGGIKGKVLAFDDFDGKLGLKWDILHPDKSHYSLSQKTGTLTITTQNGHFKEANVDYENVFLIDTPVPPGQDFQITTCLLAFQPLEPYNQAGLICWDDEDNYLEWVYQKMDRRGLNFNAGVEANGPTRYTYIPTGSPPEKLWLRLTKQGNSYQCASSTDGKSFTVHAVESWGDGSPKRVGLFALNGSLTHPPEVDASFDFFKVSAIAVAPTEPADAAPKFAIPEANLQIPDEMKDCAENLQAIYTALRKYEKVKGRMPDWLSQLVPRHLGQKTLFCPDDTSHKSRYWSDPNLPCSYCYELNPTELRSRPPLDKTMLHYKTLQRKLFGDVVPIVRCFHHGRVLNLSWDGQLYTSAVMFERLFIPNYSHNMLFEAESPKVVPSDETQYDADLEAFMQEMDRTYPLFELKGIRDDWEKTKKQLRQKVQSCTSDGQFLEIVTEAILCLRDSHMWFRSAKAQLPERPTRYYPGVSFMPATNEQVVVMSCREGLDPDLKIGTIVSRIDGKNARHYLEERAKARWAEGGISGPQRARLFAYRIPLCGEKKGEKHTITILADGKQRQVELSSDLEARGWPHWYNRPSVLKQVGSCSYTILNSGIGYIYLRRIDGNTGPGMKEAFSTYPEAKGWIIDLCGNGGGGYDQTLHEVLRALPSPLAVIIDAGCMSAGETMARDLAQQGKARLFGSKTAGASSAKRIWTLPSGIASLSVPTRSRWGIDGKPIEFFGIEPHVKVEAVPEELKLGLNSAILRAEEYITEITSAQTQ